MVILDLREGGLQIFVVISTSEAERRAPQLGKADSAALEGTPGRLQGCRKKLMSVPPKEPSKAPCFSGEFRRYGAPTLVRLSAGGFGVFVGELSKGPPAGSRLYDLT